MHKTIVLLARTTFLMMLLLVPSLAKADKQAWVEYQEGTATLTFHYDENKEVTTATAKYDLNSGSDKPGWVTDKNPKKTVTTVVFDSSFADARPTTTTRWFYTFTKLTRLDGIEYLNTSMVTDMSYMFYRCISLAELDLSHFDTGNVTTMEAMFYSLPLTKLDLSNFNTSNVKSMKRMFYDCKQLETVNVTSFNTEKTRTMYSMFERCESLTELDLTSFDLCGFAYDSDGIQRMFCNCTKLRNIMVTSSFTIRTWPTGVSSTNNIVFLGATSLPNFNASDVSSKRCKDISEEGYVNYVAHGSDKWVEYQESTATLIFHYDRFKAYTEATGKYNFNSGNSVPEWQGKDIKKVVFNKEMKKATPSSCYHWFYGMDKLASIEGLDLLNTSEVTNMAGMFHGCSLLESLDLSSFNTAKVTDMSNMLSSCTALKEVFAGENFVVANNMTSTAMFEGCTNLPGFDAGNVDAAKAKDLTVGGYLNFVNITGAPWVEYQEDTRTLTFHYDKQRPYITATGKYDFTYESNNWRNWQSTDPTKVVFCEEFSEVRPRTCVSWFQNKESLQTVEGMENLNTSEVMDMSRMFYSCSSLTSLDLTHSDTKKLIFTAYMLKGCSNLKNIYVSADFSMQNVAASDNMFLECYSLPNFDGTTTKDKANYTDGYLTLRRQFSVGEKDYNVDGYGDKALCNDDVEFTDDKAFMSSFDFKFADDKTASFTRTMANKWGTLCLPFEINADNADCNFYTIKGIDADKLTLTQLSGTIAAGTPVIISKKSDSQTGIAISSKAANVVYMPVVTENGDYLDGVLEPTYLADGKGYFLDNNKFYKVSDYTDEDKCVEVGPYCAYILTDETSSAKYDSVLNIVTDDEAASISYVIDTLNTDAKYYDINGRQTNSVQKGVNIVRLGNGKTMKICVK